LFNEGESKMGLGISVDTSAYDVVANIKYLENPLAERVALWILESMEPSDSINSLTQFYLGIHLLRAEYASMKGLQYSPHDEVSGSVTNLNSHLISHSDTSGWYLPDRFDDPIFADSDAGYSVSIGSSYKLLDEMLELLAVKDKWPQGFEQLWDALFIAAVASVVCNKPIRFH